MTESQIDPETLRAVIARELTGARQRTSLLTDSVDEADLVRQHSPLMSPLVWDLAHIANQEELWLLREVGGREPIHPEIDPLYDAFEHPRAERPTLPLLPPAEARAYGHEVRGRVLDLLERAPLTGTRLLGDGFAFGMIAQHEAQHDETMLITHQIRAGAPVLAAASPGPAPADAVRLPAEVLVPGGPFTMGTSTEPWALDNERPAHAVDVPPYLSRHHPGDLRGLHRVHRGRRVRRPALVDARPAGSTGRRPGWPLRCTGAGTAGSGPAGSSAGRSRSRRTSRCCTCAGTRPTRTPAGPAGGCRPRPSGRRRPGTIPAPS